ncbi:hypothetical protein J2S10_005282 [Neobacillus ginsengisoli]|uniref:Uncharacterized protein n=1 Tax=Neobacillus ginsengisoli TaxID=904295 RepID=A0ABT9Y2L8_9BACI|nr:hypothetical protein [Neobacillus ginsengisoli]
MSRSSITYFKFMPVTVMFLPNNFIQGMVLL